MATRYHATFESTTERNVYRVEIDDAAFSGVSTEFTLAAPGFQITYEGDGNNLFEGQIRSSRATIFPTPETSGAASFFENLTANQETDLVVRIYKNGTTMADLFWIGTVLPDLNIYPKEHRPYIYSLTAVDGLGRLENFEFEYATNSAEPEWVNMHDMFVEALKYTGLWEHFAITDTFIRFSEEWYDVNQITTRSTFATTQCRRLNLLDNYNPLQPTDLKALNCKEVIKAMLIMCGAMIEFSRGSYRVFTVTNAADASITEYSYAYDGVSIVYLSSATVAPQLTIGTNTADPPRVLAGANWAYRRPLLQCRVETESITSVAVYKAYSTAALNANVGNFDGDLTTKDMILTGRLTFDILSSTNHTGKFIWTITVGSGGTQVWLKRNDDGTLVWSTVAWTLDTLIPIEQFAGRNRPVTIQFELKIPALTTPNTGDIVIGCLYYNYQSLIAGGKTWGTPAFALASAKYDLQLIQGSGTTDIVYNNKVYANVENTDGPDNSITQVIENRFCDGSKYRLQALKVYNGAAYVYSTAWRIGTPAGTGVTLTDRLAYTVVSYQKDGYGQKVLQGGIIGDIDSVHCPVINSAVYWFVAGTFTALDDTLSGEWILLSFDNTGLNLTTGNTNIAVKREELHDRKLEDIGGMVNVLNAKVGPLHVSMVDAIINWAVSGSPTSAPSLSTSYAVNLAYENNADGNPQMQFKLSSVAAGTVSSVALAAPSELSVSGSPVTSSGTLTLAWATQTTNKVFISPNGSTGVPTFRALAHADLAASGGSGTKYLRDDMTWQTVSGGSGVTTMAAIGATPNANGASISGTTLTLQPADATYGGVLTNTTQDIAGSKRFTNATTRFTNASATVDLYGVSNFNGGFQIYAEWAIRRTPTSGGQANCIGIGTAMNTTFTGYYNIAIGDNSMAALTTGVRNCSIGLAAMQGLTTGTDNMAIGKDSMKLITTGYSNVAIGSNSLYLQSTRNNNTAIGESAGYAVDGNKNVHIGAYTSYDSGSGTLRAQNNCVIIGYQAGFQNRGDGNIYIGYQAGYSETTNSNLLIISNEYNDFLIKGSLVATKWVDINGQLRLKDVTTNTNTPSGATAKYIKIYDQAGTAYYVPGYAAPW